MQRNIFIFNPETDYALALGRKIYNPPARIAELRKRMQLIPVHLASTGDCIVVEDGFSLCDYPDQEAAAILVEKSVTTLPISDIAEMMATEAEFTWRVVPWGWNHSLRRRLLDAGVSAPLLKSEDEIDMIRSLSHRRTTIPFQRHLQSLLPDMNVPTAREFISVEEAMDFLAEKKEVYFKAPWSSSGRGILHARNDDAATLVKTRQWIGGFIRKQGSVIGEQAFDRAADFATEWWIADGQARYLGLSLFSTSADGRYIGNSPLSQEEIDRHLGSLSPDWSPEIIQAQQAALETVVAPSYSGPVGVDMLISTDGKVNPCVELNLRLTMGMVALGRPLPNWPSPPLTGNDGRPRPSTPLTERPLP